MNLWKRHLWKRLYMSVYMAGEKSIKTYTNLWAQLSLSGTNVINGFNFFLLLLTCFSNFSTMSMYNLLKYLGEQNFHTKKTKVCHTVVEIVELVQCCEHNAGSTWWQKMAHEGHIQAEDSLAERKGTWLWVLAQLFPSHGCGESFAAGLGLWWQNPLITLTRWLPPPPSNTLTWLPTHPPLSFPPSQWLLLLCLLYWFLQSLSFLLFQWPGFTPWFFSILSILTP